MSDLLEVFIQVAPLVLLAAIIAIPIAFRDRMRSSRRPSVFKDISDRVALMQKNNDELKQAISKFESRMLTRLDSADGNAGKLKESIGEVRRETFNIQKNVDTLKTKTETAASMVDTIKHQVDVDVGELKRIEDQVKNSSIKVDTSARHINYLEHEVRDLEHEVIGGPIRIRRERRID